MNHARRKRLDASKDILRAVHFPEKWITDQTAICLSALVDRAPRSGLLPGKTCLRDGARIRNILDFARRDLRKPVAENTRESYRKQSLKPLYEAGIIELHQTSINDPNTFYTLNTEFAHVLEEARPSRRAKLIEGWNMTHRTKLSVSKEATGDITVKMGALSLALSSGAHSQLTKDVCEVFAKREIHSILTKRSPLAFGVVYVTAFPDRQTFRRFVVDIAWETKVWIAAEQFGIIHFDLIARTL